MPHRIRVPSKKSISHPSSSIEDVKTWSERARTRGGALAMIIAVTLLALGGLGAYIFFQKQSEAKAGENFAQAIAFYTAGVSNAESSKDQLRRALLGFEEVEKDFPSTFQGKAAGYYVANTLFAQEEYQKSVDRYHAWLDRFPNDATIKPFVLNRLGLALERTGKTDEAMKIFGRLATLPDGPNRDIAYYEQARLYESRNQNIEALGSYQEIVENLSDSPLAAMARDRMRVLGGIGGAKNGEEPRQTEKETQ